MPQVDLTLYLVADPTATRGRALLDVVAAAVDGGVTVVQLRGKTMTSRAMVETGQALVAVLRPRRVPLIVNDRVDVALAAGADGVHLGQDDLPMGTARRLMGPDAILGVSATTVGEARAVDARVADYVGAGPVFPTGSKSDAAPPLGLDGLRAVCDVSEPPVVAIGGIHEGNAAAVMRTGVVGVSVISAICGADDPTGAARALVRAILAGRARAGDPAPRQERAP